MTHRSIYIGYDSRETASFAVTRFSVVRRMTSMLPIHGLLQSDLRQRGLFNRPVKQRVIDGKLVNWDVISEAPISTEHANTRFLVPHLAERGWALFMDGDMLARVNVGRVFDGLDESKAAYCVKHLHAPTTETKMDMQVQTRYLRKNWSSFVVWNVDHPANKELTPALVNTLPGRDLHRFCWLDDDLIGELPAEWNWLVGTSDPAISPKVVHFTEGTPDMPGYEDVPYADEWRNELARWVN